MHGLAQLCVRRPVFTTMLILALVVVGVFSYFSLGVDLFPKVDIPAVTVTVADPGASPEEVETEITKKVEDAVNTVSLIDEVRSTSAEGRSVVSVAFLLQKNGDIAAQEIQNKVNLIVADLPQTAKPPVVQKLDPDATPIIQIAVSAPRSIRDLTLIADKRIKQQLENAKGVGEITILGGARREIHVVVDPDRLRAYNLTVTDVFNAVRQQNLELPGGSLNAGAKEFTVRTTGKVMEPAQFNQIAIVNRGGYVVKISDIGYAEDSYEEPRTAARLDGKAAVTLVVAKQSGENTVATATEIKQRLKEITTLLPKDVHAEIITDQSVFIEASVNNIRHHLIEGSILASIIIFLFLANIRTTLIAAIAIPTSIISTFALMAAAGFTLNQITMLALTLMVGIVIDDAIIVLENILSLHGRKGHVSVRGRHRRDARHRFRGHGHNPFAARRFSSRRFHGRHRGPLHELLRLHFRVRHRGLAAGLVHPDADAVFALRQEAARRITALQRIVLLPHPRSQLYEVAGVVDGASQDHHAALRRGDSRASCLCLCSLGKISCRSTINRKLTC